MNVNALIVIWLIVVGALAGYFLAPDPVLISAVVGLSTGMAIAFFRTAMGYLSDVTEYEDRFGPLTDERKK